MIRDQLLLMFIGTLAGIVLIFLSSSPQVFSPEQDDVPASTTHVPSSHTGEQASATSSGIQLSALPVIPKNVRTGLRVPDQPAGKTVAVSALETKERQWVAIYDDRGGKPGWIIGATRVHPGDTDAIVEVLRAGGTRPNMTYYAALLNDDGDDEFNRLTDLPPLASERVVIVSFTTQ